MISRWWHRHRGHTQYNTKVSVPMWDPSAQGILVTCSCGKRWAL